jgi:uncharacterized membrane protein YkoI
MRPFLFCAAAFTATALLAPALRADEESVPLDKLPKAITDALKARWPDAELKKAEKNVGDDKKTIFEVAFKNKKDSLEVTFTEGGDITVIEKEMDVKDLPKAVTKALEEKYPKAELKGAEEVTKVEGKKEKLAYYEVEVKVGDKKAIEVLVDPDGKILKGEKDGGEAAEKLHLDKIPEKIMAAIKDRFPGAELKSVEKETEDGQVVFDVELTHKGLKYEMDIKEDGTILEIEKEVAVKDLPEAMAKAIEAKYPKSKITEIMEVNKVNDKKETPDHYEVLLETADKEKLELDVSLDGKSIKSEKVEGDKK